MFLRDFGDALDRLVVFGEQVGHLLRVLFEVILDHAQLCERELKTVDSPAHAGIPIAQAFPMSNQTNNPAPHAGEKEPKHPEDGQTPGMAKPPAADPKNPASKPHGSTSDQIANMESEGQAQEAPEPDPADATATTPPGHQKEKRATL